jgi:hypothetical protein
LSVVVGRLVRIPGRAFSVTVTVAVAGTEGDLEVEADSSCDCLLFFTGLPVDSNVAPTGPSIIREMGRSSWTLLRFVVDIAETLELRETFEHEMSDISERRMSISSTSSGSSTMGENAGPANVIGG